MPTITNHAAGAKSTYWELLQHPNWQKKRLEILECAGFECENCGSKKDTLHVHHSYYEKGLKPWEYPNESMHCLCKHCHQKAQDWMTLLHRQIGKIGAAGVEQLTGYAFGLKSLGDKDAPINVPTFEFAEGLGNCWEIGGARMVLENLEKNGTISGNRLLELRRSVVGDTRGAVNAAN